MREHKQIKEGFDCGVVSYVDDEAHWDYLMKIAENYMEEEGD